MSTTSDPRSQWRPVREGRAKLVEHGDRFRLESPISGRCFEISAVAVIIWESLEGTATLGEIADDLAAASGTSPTTQLETVVDFVSTLDQNGLLASVGIPTVAEEADAAFGSASGESSESTDAREPPRATIAYDFIMEPYEMTSDPAGRPTSRDLFFAVVREGSREQATLQEIVEAMVEAVGPERTVWGAKWVDTTLIWELYFYGPRSPDGMTPPEFIDRACDAFAEVGGWNAPVGTPENANLASFEFGIDPDGRVRAPRAIDLYHAVPHAEMIVNYERSAERYRLKNTYQIFGVPTHIDRLEQRLGESRYAFENAATAIPDFWLARLRETHDCRIVWCSYKPDCDGIYLGQVDVRDLAGFLDEFAYPGHLRAWVAEHLDDLDHLRYDLGFDYTVVDGRVVIPKTGFYGYF